MSFSVSIIWWSRSLTLLIRSLLSSTRRYCFGTPINGKYITPRKQKSLLSTELISAIKKNKGAAWYDCITRGSNTREILSHELFILNLIGSTEFGGLIIRTFITFYWTRKLSYTTLIPYLNSMWKIWFYINILIFVTHPQ
jgi:hypothetical protein